MNHQDHVDLLRGSVTGGIWADLGAGSGAFTLALADLIGPEGTVHALDMDGGALKQNASAMSKLFPAVKLHTHQADFTQSLELPPLDGIVMANALHCVPRQNQRVLVANLRKYLRAEGRFILIEYDVDSGNRWVPHPLSYTSWQKLAAEAGFSETRFLARKPSRFLKAIYAAVSS